MKSRLPFFLILIGTNLVFLNSGFSASTKCLSSFQQFFSSEINEVHTVKKRIARGKSMREALEAGEVQVAYDVLMESHTTKVGPSGKLKGRSKLGDRILWRLRTFNHNSKVPAFFHKLRKASRHAVTFSPTDKEVTKGIDTLSIVANIFEKPQALSVVEVSALEEVEKWIAETAKYKFKMKSLFAEAQMAIIQVQEFETKILPLINRENFEKVLNSNDELLQLTSVIYDKGSDQFIRKVSKVRFSEYDDMLSEYKRLKGLVKKLLTRDDLGRPVDEWFRRSAFYEVMTEQAIWRRRLELIVYELQRIPEAQMHESQTKLLNRLVNLLMKEELFPREDTVTIVQKWEIRAEVRAAFRFWRKNLAKNTKLDVPTEHLKNLRKLSPLGWLTKYIALTSAVGSTGVLALTPDDEYPRIRFFWHLMLNNGNAFIYYVKGSTPALKACSETDRAWTLDEISMNNWTDSMLSRYRYLSRISDDEKVKNYLNDPEYISKKLDLIKICLEQRGELGIAAEHDHTKWLINHGRRELLDTYLVGVLDFTYEGNDKERLVQLVEDFLEAEAMSKLMITANDEEEYQKTAKQLKAQITAHDPDVAVHLDKYLEDVAGAVKVFERTGSMPNELDSYFDSLTQK